MFQVQPAGGRPWRRGLPVAFVAQDGQEDLPVPWDQFDALFLGGSTAWKLSPHAKALAAEAKARAKWLHMGRVNSNRRLALALGSVDGSGYSMFPDQKIPKALDFIMTHSLPSAPGHMSQTPASIAMNDNTEQPCSLRW